MELLTHQFSLDVNETTAQVCLNCKLNDTAIRLEITLTDKGIPYSIAESCLAIFTATKADTNFLYNKCKIEGNTIIYEFTEQTVNCPGQVDCEIRLSNGEKLLTSPSFILIVDKTIVDEKTVASTDETTALVNLVAEATNARDDANDAAKKADDATKAAVDATEAAVDATEAAVDAMEAANTAAERANGAAAGVVAIEQNKQKPLKFWVGTREEFAALTEEENVFYIFPEEEPLMYPVDSQYIAASPNVNPAKLFGGTWKLVDKGFKNEYVKYEDGGIPNDYFTISEGSKTKAINIHCTRSGATVRLRLGITSEETFTDTGRIELGTLNYQALGFTEMPMGYNYTLATTDEANGALMVDLHWKEGVMNVSDVLNGTSITSQYPYYLDLTFTVTPDRMIDSFCDKFYWKRTA